MKDNKEPITTFKHADGNRSFMSYGFAVAEGLVALFATVALFSIGFIPYFLGFGGDIASAQAAVEGENTTIVEQVEGAVTEHNASAITNQSDQPDVSEEAAASAYSTQDGEPAVSEWEEPSPGDGSYREEDAVSESSDSTSDEASSQSAAAAREASVPEASQTSQKKSASQLQAAEDEPRKIAKRVKSSNGDVYRVTVAYDESAGIPEGAELSVVESVKEPSDPKWREDPAYEGRPLVTERFQSARYLADRAVALAQGLEVLDEGIVMSPKFLDIQILSDGAPVELSAPVDVVVETNYVDVAQGDSMELAVFKPVDSMVSGALEQADSTTSDEEAQRSKRITTDGMTAEALDVENLTFDTDSANGKSAANPKMVKLGFSTGDATEIGEIGLACVAEPKAVMWRDGSVKVEVLGPRSSSVSVRNASFGSSMVDAGQDVLGAFSFGVEPKREGGSALWLRASGADRQSGLTAMIVEENGEAGQPVLLDDDRNPVSLTSTDRVALLNGIDADIQPGERTASEETQAVIDMGTVKAIGTRVMERSSTSFAGEAYDVTLSYGPEAGLDEGASLQVRELSSAELTFYREHAKRVLDADGLTYARAFDVKILNGQGKELEPQAPVEVSVTLAGAPVLEKLDVVHFGKGAACVVESDASVAGHRSVVDFTTDSFSVYVVAAPVQKRTVSVSDGSTYEVTATYSLVPSMPANAELRVSEIRPGDAGYDEYIEKSFDKIGAMRRDTPLARAFDIALLDPSTGEEIQPSADVKVGVNLLDDDLGDYASVDVVHIHGGESVGEQVDAIPADVSDETVEFVANAFSVYVVAGSHAVRPRCTYTFHVLGDDGIYKELALTDSAGKTIYHQTVKSGNELIVPQMTSTDTHVFAGWYIGRIEGASVKFDEQAYDFSNAVIEEDSAIDLYAVYKNYAYVVFHDQYDAESHTFPIAYTRRAELVSTDEQPEASATLKIDGLSTAYKSGEGGSNMAFFGWSKTPITIPGSENDDFGNSVSKLQPDEDGYVAISGNCDLYPIYKKIHWLTYYSAQSGMSASYVAPQYYFEGESVPVPLPVTARDGYTFLGWETGALTSTIEGGTTVELVNDGKQITNPDGSLVASADDGGVYISGGDLYLRADTTLYALWESSYRIVIWKQKTSDSLDLADNAKQYEYADTVTVSAHIGDHVSLPAEYRDEGTSRKFPGYVFNQDRSSIEATIGNTKEISTLNVYYDLTETYQASGTSHTLTFVDSESEGESANMPAVVSDLKYGEKLSARVPANPVSARKSASGKELFSFDSWFFDKACTVKAELNDMTMPDHDLVLYAGWTAKKFRVDIDPNYGALYTYEGTAPSGTGATYFNNTYDAEPIGEYTHVTRDYVESSSGTYYYVNHDRSFDGKPDRFTYYTDDPSKATEDTTFEYSPGSYSYAGWYEVFLDEQGNEIGEADQPYDFSQHTDHNTKLRLHWKKKGTYYLAYSAGIGTLDDGEMKDELLADQHSDNASVVLTRSAHAPSGYSFVGWQVRGSESTQVYAPGQNLVLNADDAIRISGKEIVYLDAVYVKVDTASIVYDANGGTIDVAQLDFGKTIDAQNSESAASGTSADGKATVSGLDNNSKFRLSTGSGFSYVTGASTFELKGWSTKPVYDPADSDARFYALSSECVVDAKEPRTLYAVWGAKVTYGLGNDASGWGGPGDAGIWNDPYSYDSVSNTHSQSVYLKTVAEEPPYVPTYSGGDNRLFGYWAKGSADGEKYDFAEPVSENLDLYAHWSEPGTFAINIIDASEEIPVDKTSDSGWTAGTITVGTSEISLDSEDAATYVTSPEAYKFAFAAAHDPSSGVQALTENEAITAIKYDGVEKSVCVKYDGAEGFSPLEGGKQIYFVYYKAKTLNIVYSSMAEDGKLEPLSVKQEAPRVANALGSYSMQSSIDSPLSLIADGDSAHTHYAFAIGDANATTANALTVITDAAGRAESAPTLEIRNTWRGFEYTTDNATWVSCGYSPTLYVTYFKSEPTVVTFSERTVGTSAVMSTGFTFNYRIIEVAQRADEGAPVETKVYDTTDSGNSSITLQNGEAYSTILFHNVDKTQKLIVSQQPDERFATSITVDGESQDSPSHEFTYEADGSIGTKTVTFTNTHKTISVEVHVAVVEGDGSVGGIVRRDSFRASESDKYSFELDLGKREVLKDKLPAGSLFSGDTERYAFGAIMYGTGSQADGQAIAVASMGVASIGYEWIDGNLYELVLNDAEGKKIAELGSSELYYLYYPKPRIKYVKESPDGTFSPISGSTADANGILTSVDSITYNHKSLTMNGFEVAQNQSFEIPLEGFLISQTGNSFRMPPILDDGLYERYLSYARIGTGNGDAQSVQGLADVSDALKLHLKVQNNTFQYSFDDSTWKNLPLSGTPTIYAIYAERGYDFLITKTVDMSSSGDNPIFANSTYPVTISSAAITKASYDAEGADKATVEATPADGSKPGVIRLTVGDGTRIKIKGLGQGDYIIEESDNENYLLKVNTGRIVGGTSSQLQVVDNSKVSLSLNAETKLDLINSPKPLCRIVDNGSEKIFYTLQSAVDYVEQNIATYTATIEMLADYLMPAADTVTIPQGLNITIETANDGFEGSGSLSVITRAEQLADMPLFVNNGTLRFKNIVLEGASIPASEPIIRSAGDVTVDQGAVIRNAISSGEGAAINASSGNITVNGSVVNNRAAQGGAIRYAGNGAITISGNGTLKGNVSASGDGGAVYASGGTVTIAGTAQIEENSAPNGRGGALYVGNAVVNIDQNPTIQENTAKAGGAIYAETGTITVTKTDGVNSPVVKNNTASEGDGGAIWVGAGSVKMSGGVLSENSAPSGRGGLLFSENAAIEVSGSSKVEANEAQEGGAIYSSEGTVTVSGGEVTLNKANKGDGGAVYAGSGNVTVSGGTVAGNSTENGNGGAVFAGNGNVTVSGGTVTGNNAGNGNGGAVFAGSGNVIVSGGTVAHNEAGKDGGAVCANGGAVTVSCESMKDNKAANGRGGAVFAETGSVTVNGTELSDNTAYGDGGAVFANAGSVSITNGTFRRNKATDGRGGAVFAEAGNVTISAGLMEGSYAAKSGGALYVGNGTLTASNAASWKGNESGENGGAVFVGSGSATLTALDMTENKAVNGAALYIEAGKAACNAGSYTGNVASSGGAIGVGGNTVRLTFTGDVKVVGNKLGVAGEAPESNIYLDQDSDDVLTMGGLGTGASLGIYVADAVTEARDVPGARFSTYTSDSNVDKIKNDRFGFSIQKDAVTKKLFWGMPIKIEVRYQSSFKGGLPPTAGFDSKYSNDSYYPEFSSAAISELAEELFNKDLLKNMPSAATYGGAFEKSASSFDDYVTQLKWDVSEKRWTLVKRNGETAPLGYGTIVIYYADPAYISIENNTDFVLSIFGLQVGGKSVINSETETGYGMLFAKNGAIRSALLPITRDDLTLPVGASVNLLIPGGREMSYTLNGKFDGDVGDGVRVRRTGQSEATLSPENAISGFNLEGTTLSGTGTYEIIFGEDKQVCKIEDKDGEHPFSKISAAVEYAKQKSLKTTTIEMLADYLLPASDKVEIPRGYNITLTTAAKETGAYRYIGEGDRAIISRDSENKNAMIATVVGNEDSSLHVKDLVFDGKSVRGTSDGGAVKALFFAVKATNVEFKNVYAAQGGALYVDDYNQQAKGKKNSIAEVQNCSFTNCNSTKAGQSRIGGGAIHAYTDTLVMKDCVFDSCDGGDQAGAVFHRVEGNYDSWTRIDNCTFNNCTAKAAGALELDSKYIEVKNSVFEHCVATQRNGGGFNVYAANAASPAATTGCSVEVANCTFNDCHADSTSQANYGGGFRSNAVETKVLNSNFKNCSSRYGGGIGVSNVNATKAVIQGCTLEECKASTNDGGGIYSLALVTEIGDYEAGEQSVHTSITNCTAASSGGGVYFARDANGSQLSVTNADIRGNVATKAMGGGVYASNAREVAIEGSTISGNRSGNTSAGHGGGLYLQLKAAQSATIKTSTISGNTSAGGGGGLYAQTSTGVILAIEDSTISANTSGGAGGGLWFDSTNDNARNGMSLNLQDSSVVGNRSGGQGGGVCTQAKRVSVVNVGVNSNEAGTFGGGIYHTRNAEGSALEITDSHIEGNAARSGYGGGVAAGVRVLTAKNSSVSKCSATGDGGGIWFDVNNDAARNSMQLDIAGCAFDNNASEKNGGAIYTLAKTVALSALGEPGSPNMVATTIKNCEAAASGGGIYHNTNANGSKLSLSNTVIAGCAAHDVNTQADRGGGGIAVQAEEVSIVDSELSGNNATRNGGAINALKDSNDWRVTVDHSKVTGNMSGNFGGGIYTRSQLTLKNGTEITGNRLSTESAGNAAGVYILDNRTLTVGAEDAERDKVVVNENYTAAGASSNVRLWSNKTAENNKGAVSVVCSNLEGEIRVVNANKVGTQFGNSLIAKPDGFSDDAPVFKADGSTLHGIIDRMDELGKRIIWAGQPIAKITDADGNLLYLKSNKTDPAIFDRLNAANNADAGTTSAFGVLNAAIPQLYTAEGSLYEGNSYCIKMLVDSFTSEASLQTNKANFAESSQKLKRSLVITTADKDDDDGYPFEGRAGGRATVMRGVGVDNASLIQVNSGNITFKNIIFDGGSENGIKATGYTRILNIGDDGSDVTLGENATLQNSSITGTGAGANVNKGIFNIDGGVIRNCTAAGNGGGVYTNSSKSVSFIAGNIYQCNSNNNGGGVYVSNGSLNMSGGTISACSSKNQGGGIFLAAGKTLNMSGGSIIGNDGGTAGGGIAIGDNNNNTRLNFSQKVTVSGNTAMKDGRSVACNVELNRDTNAIINTNNGGLFPGSYIGVYVIGDDDSANSIYTKHGMEKTPFGTYASGDKTSNLYSFVNDRNGLKGGILDASDASRLIYWVKIFSLQVVKQVEAGASSAVDPDEEFEFTVNIRGEANSEGQPDAKDIDSSVEQDKYGEMQFRSNGTDTTTATFKLKAGESITGVSLSEGLDYEIIEKLGNGQEKRYSPIPTTLVVGNIGENRDRTDIDPYTSVVKFTNVMPVCKITDNNGNLLYKKYTIDDGLNKKDYKVPAVYTELTGQAGAFEALSGTLYSSSDANSPSFSTGNGVQIQMLIDNYTVMEPVTLPATVAGTVTLTTASPSAKEFPYLGSTAVSTVRRGYAGESMVRIEGSLLLGSITLDGVKGSGNASEANSNGGIFNVVGDGELEIQNNATLQNSKTTKSGAAVYVDDGGTVSMNGGKVQKNESDGEGAGIYLAEGSTLNMEGSVDFGGTGLDRGGNIVSVNGDGNYTTASLTAKNNGGKSYVKPRQDIFIAETGENPSSLVLSGNLSGSAGSIWVWAEHEAHYAMMKPFARLGSGSVSAGTYAIFRNARTDDLTLCGSDGYLTGSSGENPAYMYWTGGFDVSLKKIDGFGHALAGAEFTLYRDAGCTDPYLQRGVPATLLSADGSDAFKDAKGNVLGVGEIRLDNVSGGTYYMKETRVPEGYGEAGHTYVVLVGDGALSGTGGGVLANIDEEQIRAQLGDGASKAAVFLLGADGKAIATPDIAKYGIMNVSATSNRAILKKVNPEFTPLPGATFDILRYDRTVVAENQEALQNGVFWIGDLPYGTYYLHETSVPDGYAKLEGNDNWYSVTVNADGVSNPERLSSMP